MGASLTVLMLSAQVACASCVPNERPLPVKVAEAKIAFVGTVLTVANGGRNARIQVEEIWKGPELGEQVVVHGVPDGVAATSVDRVWQPGVRYLVFPRRGEAGLEDDACSPTAAWEPGMAALRPDQAQPVEQGGGRVPTTARPTEWVFVGVVILVLVLGIGWLVRRNARRRRFRA